ncbi:MAG: hypothetical protein SWK90_17720 [Chloroflexota bacterium]|nr:hypothetical protein [Chloroflexota bacterium]
MTKPQNPKSQIGRWSLVIILLLAVFLRLYRLDSIPPGLTHDEADLSHDAIAVYHGARPLYIATHGYQDEPFMHYASAITMSLLGPSYLAVRVTSALFGILLVFLTFLWARLALGTKVALGAAAWVAVSYWPVSTSRFAVQVEPIASLATLANIFFWLGLGLGRRESGGTPDSKWREAVYWISFTLCVAASIYAYEAARVTWVLFPLFSLYLALVRADLFKRNWWKVTLTLATAALLSLPLLTHPAAWDRAGSLSAPLEALMRGSFGPILVSIRDVLAMFTFKGDPFVTYNLPGRPILDPVTGLLFYGGILVCLWRWREPAYAFTLLWLVTGIAPSMLTGVHSATLRSIVAQPATYLAPALLFVEGAGWLARRFRLPATPVILVGLVLVLASGGLITGYDYFVRWASAPETQAAYFSDLFQAIRYLDADYSDRPILLSSPFPTLPHDPYVAAVMPTRHDLDIRWFDGRRALLFPASPSVRLAVLSRAPLDRSLSGELRAYPRGHVQIESTEYAFDIFDWEPGGALEAARRDYGRTTVRAGERLMLPVDLGHSVQLDGYSLEPPTIVAGGTLRLVTLWRVLSPEALGPVPPGFYGYDAAIFVHVLNSAGQVVAQEDRLDVPAWNWRAGDTFVQIHHLTTEPDLPPGRYDVEIGLYTRPDLRRLPVYAGGETKGDHILLDPVEVTSQ